MDKHIAFTPEALDAYRSELLGSVLLSKRLAHHTVLRDSIDRIFVGVAHSVPSGLQNLTASARYVDDHTKTDGRVAHLLSSLAVDLVNDLVLARRLGEAVELSREAALASRDNRVFCRTTSALWAEAVHAVFEKNPDHAKGMIVAARDFSTGFDTTFVKVIAQTRQQLGLSQKGILQSVRSHTSMIHFRHASHL